MLEITLRLYNVYDRNIHIKKTLIVASMSARSLASELARGLV
jgi:hypothetical protein